MSTKTVSRIVALLLALAAVCSFGGCSSGRRLRASFGATRVVATAGDREIAYETLYYLAMNRAAEMREERGETVFDDEAARAELAAFVRDNLLDSSLALLSVAAEYGLDVDKGTIADSVQADIEQLIEEDFDGERRAYAESLNSAYLTDHYVRTHIAVENYLATAVVLEMLRRGELDSSDAAARALIDSADFARTIHVYIDKFNGFSDEENRAHANEVQASVAKGANADARYSAMREAIGGRYNNDYGDTGGYGYYFARGEMDEAYEAAAFALEVGDVSEVVETGAGYYIIMRLEKDKDYIAQNFQSLKEKTYFILLNRKVEERLATMTLTMTDFGNSLDLTALPPIDADGGEWIVTVGIVAGSAVAVGAVALVIVLFVRKRGAKTKD